MKRITAITEECDFTLRIRAKRIGYNSFVKVGFDEISNIIVNLISLPSVKSPVSYSIDSEGRLVIPVTGESLVCNMYGIEILGFYNNGNWRHQIAPAFEIVKVSAQDNYALQESDDCTIDFEITIGETYASSRLLEKSVEGHNENPEAHQDIRESITHLQQGVAEAGTVHEVEVDDESIVEEVTVNGKTKRIAKIDSSKFGQVDDILLDGVSILGQDKVARIDSSGFGHVDDVQVNGESVLDPETKTANITMPTKVSEIENDADFATKEEAQAMADENQINEVEITVNQNVGTPSATAFFDQNKLRIEFERIMGDGIEDMQQTTTSTEPGGINVFTVVTVGGKVGNFQVRNGTQGDTVILDVENQQVYQLYNGTGQNTDGAMTQQAVTNELNKLKNALDGAFNNWEEKVQEGRTLYNGNVSSEVGLDYASKPIEAGEVVKITTEGSGSLTVYVYWTNQSNPKTALATLSGNDSKTVIFSLGSYQSYHRLLLYPSGSIHAKVEIVAPEAEGMSLSDAIAEEVEGMIQEALEEQEPPEITVDENLDEESTNPVQNQAVAKQMKLIKGGLDKICDNWYRDTSGDVKLYEGTFSSEVSLPYSSKPVEPGDIIRVTTSGSGSLTVYVYWTSAVNPKTALATLSGEDSKIFTFSLGSHESYHRLLLYPSGSVHAKVEILSEMPEDISLAETMQNQIIALVEEHTTPDSSGEVALMENNTTDNKTIQKSDSKFSNFQVGDYIKIVVGSGTVGSWYFTAYLTASNNPKNTYSSNLVPNKTYYFKIYNDFNRIYFSKNDSCDAPISVYLVSRIENDVLDLKAKKEDDSNYFNKGKAQKSFTKLPLIIVAGQSNADGRVPVADLPAEYDLTEPNTDVHVYNGNGFTSLGTGYFSQSRWAFDIVTLHHLSLVKECYLVKHAKGATRLTPHSGGSDEAWSADYENLGTSLLRQLENKIVNAMSLSNDFDIRAILWHQGEGDCNWGDEQHYYVQLKRFIAYLRGVCGNAKLPFIGGTISHNSGQYSRLVEEAQLKVASEDKYVTYIDMSGATLLDGLHFDADSSVYLGKMMYNALIDYGVINAEKLDVECPWAE